MTGNVQQGEPHKQPRLKSAVLYSALVQQQLHISSPHKVDIMGWEEGGHIMNGAACPERCASSVVSNDGSEETGTEAGGRGLSGFLLRMTKCSVRF